MDDKILKALKKSIKTWEKRVKAKHPSKVLISYRGCALCAAVNELAEYTTCNGCPVQESVGEPNCFETPFYDAMNSFRDWHKHPNSSEVQADWKTDAQSEVDFLKSLLPKE